MIGTIIEGFDYRAYRARQLSAREWRQEIALAGTTRRRVESGETVARCELVRWRVVRHGIVRLTKIVVDAAP